MMYIHRIKLDRRFSPKRIHGILENSDQKTARKLWRVDEINGKQYLLIVSEEEKINSAELGTLESKRYDGFLSKLQKGQKWRFRLTANPTVCRKVTSAGKEKRKRFPLTISGQQMYYIDKDGNKQPGWLTKRAEENGFSLDSLEVMKSDDVEFRKNDRNIVTVRVSDLEGVLTITDADKLRTAMTEGIGHGKAYGCGLLTLVRL
jgi:CRISPR system Cascade subunit CasE